MIQVLSVLVAVNLSAGVVAYFARSGPASAATQASRVSHPQPQTSGTTGSGGGTVGGILAGGQFAHQRKSTDKNSSGATGTADPASSGTTSAPATSPPSTGRPATTTTRPGATPGATGPAVTTPTSGPVTTDNSAPPAGASATSTPSSGRATTTTTAPAGSVTSSSVLDDRTGDTIIDETDTAKAEGRADIVRTRAEYTSQAIVFALQDARPIDPRQDPNWASDSTYISWQIDTNGDGTSDYEAQYYLDSGAPIAGVSRVGDSEGNTACDAEAGYTADGYTLAIDPGCIGRPASFSYKVSIFWDTNPKDENADVIADTAPDGGLSRPIARPAG